MTKSKSKTQTFIVDAKKCDAYYTIEEVMEETGLDREVILKDLAVDLRDLHPTEFPRFLFTRFGVGK